MRSRNGNSHGPIGFIIPCFLFFSILGINVSSEEVRNPNNIEESRSGYNIVNWEGKTDPQILRHMQPPLSVYEYYVKENKYLVVGKIHLDGGFDFEFRESPGDIIGDYNSELLITKDGAHLISAKINEVFSNKSLSIAYSAYIPDNNRDRIVILNYVGQPSEVNNGFVLVRFAKSGPIISVLPLVLYGKISVNRKHPDVIHIWTADEKNISGKNTPTPYSKRSCAWKENAYVCNNPRIEKHLYIPNTIIDTGIEIKN